VPPLAGASVLPARGQRHDDGVGDLPQSATTGETAHQRFGGGEFPAMVTQVASIELNLGIYDLDQFTPQVTAFTSRS
jgi:hypothetical protein